MSIPCQVGARIAKSGRQVFFSIADLTPVNGVCKPGIVTAVSGSPTVRRPDGTPIRLGRPRACLQTGSSPIVSYGLQCGSVDRLLIVDGGEGYGPDTVRGVVDNTDTGGSGLSLGDVVVEQGVTSYTVSGPGGGYPLPPTCSIVDLAATNPGSGALCFPIISEGQIRKIVIDPNHRGSGYQQPVFQVSSGVAAGIVVTDANGSVVEVLLTNFGNQYPNPPTVTVPAPPNSGGPRGNVGARAVASVYGADAAAWNATPGSLRGVYPAVGGRPGCGQGYAPSSHPKTTISPPPSGGSLPVVIANVTGYVAAVKKAFGGLQYNSPPLVTVPGGTRPAVVRVIMTGASPDDRFTYDSPDSWLQCKFPKGVGVTAVSTGVAVDNFSGRWEGPAGGMPAMYSTPTMRVGGNHGSGPVLAVNGAATFANKLHTIDTFLVRSGNGTVTYGPDGLPSSWTDAGNMVMNKLFYVPRWSSGIDNMGLPNIDGPWSMIYGDPNVGNADAFVPVLISGADATNLIFTPWSLSGPTAPIVIPPGNITMSGTAISQVSLDGVQVGSGWQGAGILALDPAGAFGGGMLNVTVTDGVPSAINVIVGGNYPKKPTVYLYGTLVDGLQVSHVIDIEYIPTTTPGTGPSDWGLSLAISIAQRGGRWTWDNPWVTAPDPRSRRPSLFVDRTNPYLVDQWVLDQLRDENGTTAAGIRFMDATGDFGGPTSYTFADDLIDGSILPWIQDRSKDYGTFQFARAFNTDPDSTVYPWFSDRVYGLHAFFASGQSDAFGNYIPLPPSDMGGFMQTEPWWGVVELRSLQPHNLTTGQFVTFRGDQVVPFADGGSSKLNLTTVVFVTGPNTVLISPFVGGGTHTKFPVQTVAGNVEIPVSITSRVHVPLGQAVIPYEYTAAFVKQLPGCTLWSNAPVFAIEECTRAYIRKIIANIGPDNDVCIEHGNENWQVNWENITWHLPFSGLLSYLPPDAKYLGVPIRDLGGSRLIRNNWLGYALATANTHAVCLDEWTKAGLDPARLRFVYGTQFGYDAVSVAQLSVAFNGNFPIDYLAGAYYPSMPSEPSYMQAASPPGSLVGSEESITVEEIAELYRWYFTTNQDYWQYYAGAGLPCLQYGQPLQQCALPVLKHVCTYNSSGGVVQSVLVQSPGGGLTQNPRVVIDKPAVAGSRAASARSFLAPSPIDKVVVLSGGSKYTAPQVTLVGGGGTYQSATATVDNGVITGITVVGSAGYVTTDDVVVQIVDPTGGGATFSVYLVPTSLASVSVIDGGAKYADATAAAVRLAGGGMLQGGTYSLSYTFTGGDGVETTIGSSESGNFTLLNNNVLSSVMPACPPWVQSINFYLRPAGKQPILYRSFTRSEYQSTYPRFSTFTMEMPLNLANASPPTQVSPNPAIGRMPQLAHYEFAFQRPIPWNTPLQNFLLEDILMSEAGGDMMDGLMNAAQQGHPQYPGTGSSFSMFFSIYGFYQIPNCWELLFGTRQVAGDGSQNLMCTPQGGEPGDYHDHTRDNVSPTMERFRKWFSATSREGPFQSWSIGAVS